MRVIVARSKGVSALIQKLILRARTSAIQGFVQTFEIQKIHHLKGTTMALSNNLLTV